MKRPAWSKIVSSLSPYVKGSRLERMESCLAARTRGVALVLENLDNPSNVAAVARTCDGFGVQRLGIIQTSYAKANGFNKDVSKGSEKYLSIERYDDAWQFLERAGQRGSVVATEMGAPCITEVDWSTLPRPVYFVLGNETRGVSTLVRQNASRCVSLPSWGMVQSYNVSVAAAVLLTHLYDQRVLQNPPTCDDALLAEEHQEILARWLISDVPASGTILKRNSITPPDF